MESNHLLVSFFLINLFRIAFSTDYFRLNFLHMNLINNQLWLYVLVKMILFGITLLHWLKASQKLSLCPNSSFSQISNVMTWTPTVFSKQVNYWPFLWCVFFNKVILLSISAKHYNVLQTGRTNLLHFIRILYCIFKNNYYR